MSAPDSAYVSRSVATALQEDVGTGDLTAQLIPADRIARASVITREDAVLCGTAWFDEVFRQIDPRVRVTWSVRDGERVRADQQLCTLDGPARSLLTGERAALNFLQMLSATASVTRRYVDAVAGTKCRILDTRKTIPGLRIAQKYAVRCGGGTNHRMDLSSAVLIKDNHLAAVDGDVGLAVRRARDLAPAGTKIEVECDRIEQVNAAVEAGADIIMLDNMGPDEMAGCVELVRGRAITEASGGVSLQTVRAIAKAGVDWISVGALTHSAPALDLALDFE
jgi:nicotinate-nucleotide pyrophosphorylase (carboxylating)